MSLKIRQNLVHQSKWPIKAPAGMVPQYITVHNTANDASAWNEIAYMISNNEYNSFHYAVDNIEAVQGLPLDRHGWHAGDGNGTGNKLTIGIEICFSLNNYGGAFYDAENNGAILVAMLLKQYGWGVDRVRKHQDWSGKYCPHRTLDMGWSRFLDKVKMELNKLNGSNKPSSNDRYTNKQPTKVWVSDVMRPGEDKGRMNINTRVTPIRTMGNATEVRIGDALMGWVANVDLSTGPTNIAPPPSNQKKYTNKQPTRVWISDVMRPGEDKGRLDINTQVEVRRVSGSASECWINGYLHGWVANVDLSNEKTIVQQPDPTPPKDDCAAQLEAVKKERDALKAELEKFSPISNAYIKK